MGPERSKPLHNFTLPCGLKWGNQKFLRCVKVDSDRRREPEVVDRRRPNGSLSRKFRSVNGDSDEGIEAVREKLMFDLQTETDKMKDAILRKGLDFPVPAPETVVISDAGDLARPWNLRSRRAACNEANGFIAGAGGSGGGGSKIDVNRTNGLTPLRTDNNKSSRFRSDFAGGASCSGEKRERVKYSVSLSRREREEDFMAMVGHRPPRRPKKRPKLVQNKLDTLFPGLWLTEITAELYKVNEDQ
ncbi:hypothetical protein K7X08_031442 [Anisodus acutangulus]|uniref:DUF1639 family protein n=1 Tax=Anisodus acutangulus TaxID=402998 RepID=A0A9Q1ML50_9SOLA|nr:hypothetical protein K7X08_031442 [Anisodus acutangulus]